MKFIVTLACALVIFIKSIACIHKFDERPLRGAPGFTTFEIIPSEIPGLRLGLGNGRSIPAPHDRRIRVAATGDLIVAWEDLETFRRILDSEGIMSIANAANGYLEHIGYQHYQALSPLLDYLQPEPKPFDELR